MRRWVVTSMLLVIAVGWTAGSIPLCEYRSPRTDLADLSIGFTYHYRNDPYGLSDYDVNKGQFLAEYSRLYDAPTYGFDIFLSNDMMISVLDVTTYTVNADANYKYYFEAEQDLFAFAGASARSSSSFEALGLFANLGIGYGRFTDVTPLAKAIRIESYLIGAKSLSKSLHPVDLQIIAYEIGSIAAYETFADLLTVIQQIIEDSGQVKPGGLDALDISMISRLVRDEGFTRYCGWDAKIGLGYEILDPSGGARDLLVTGSANYAFTTTPRTQLLVQGAISGPPALLQQNRIEATASYDYLVSDFLTIVGSYAFTRETWAGEPTDVHRVDADLVLTPLDRAAVTLGIALEHRPYYLEWSVDILLSITMDIL